MHKQNGFSVTLLSSGSAHGLWQEGCSISHLPVWLGTQRLAWVMQHGLRSPTACEADS